MIRPSMLTPSGLRLALRRQRRRWDACGRRHYPGCQPERAPGRRRQAWIGASRVCFPWRAALLALHRGHTKMYGVGSNTRGE
eukprot:7333647-Prymnesium_polylepis.1